MRFLSIVCVLRLLSSLTLCPAAAGAEEIWIEAEDCRDHTYSGVVAAEGNSGGKILFLKQDKAPPAGGYFARFPFEIREAGRYHIWAATSVMAKVIRYETLVYARQDDQMSRFWTRLDGGLWRHFTRLTPIDEHALPGILKRFGHGEITGWVKLDSVNFKPGRHTVEFKVDERREIGERAYTHFIDALLITPRNVYPVGLEQVEKLTEPAPWPPAIKRPGLAGPPVERGCNYGLGWQNLYLKSLGFDFLQTDGHHMIMNEPRPGEWDWRDTEAALEGCRAAGVDWHYFTHYHWPPEYYRKSDRFVPCSGLRSGKRLPCISAWSPDIVHWYERCFDAFRQKYGNRPELKALMLGVHGDFGEPIFPMGWHPWEKKYFGEAGTGDVDYWCAAPEDRRDFSRFALKRYGDLAGVNKAWDTRFEKIEAVDYPPSAYSDQSDPCMDAAPRRRRLDFCEWYYGEMTRLAGEVCRIARERFPGRTLILPLGGGSEHVCLGQDITALVAQAGRHGITIRSTHGGYDPFPENSATMLRRVASACKFYQVPLMIEGTSPIPVDRELGRFMEVLQSGASGFFTWYFKVYDNARFYHEYADYLTRERPVTDVALFFPTSDHRLRPGQGYPSRLKAVGAALRDLMDYDIVDERMIADGALGGYRVLFWLDGDYAEAETIKRIGRWIEAGGVLVKLGGVPPRTIEGDDAPGCALLGRAAHARRMAMPDAAPCHFEHECMKGDGRDDAFLADGFISEVDPEAVVLATVQGKCAAWSVRRGRGWALVWAGDGAAHTRDGFYRLAGAAVYHLRKLDAAKNNAPELDGRFDGMYATLLERGEAVYFNMGAEARTARFGNQSLVVPGRAMRSLIASPRKSRELMRNNDEE